MEIERFITRKDFLRLKPFTEGGTLIDGRRYAALPFGELALETQLKNLGMVDKTGEGVVDRVFFFEILLDPLVESMIKDYTFQLISAKIVERYKFGSEQEAYKEAALIKAKIVLRNKELGKDSDGEEDDRQEKDKG